MKRIFKRNLKSWKMGSSTGRWLRDAEGNKLLGDDVGCEYSLIVILVNKTDEMEVDGKKVFIFLQHPLSSSLTLIYIITVLFLVKFGFSSGNFSFFFYIFRVLPLLLGTACLFCLFLLLGFLL